MSTLLTQTSTETSRAHHPFSDPPDLQQAGLAHHEERSGRGERDGLGKTKKATRVRSESCSSNEYFLNRAVPEKPNNSIEDPSKKYARRARHKTKEDRYD